MRNLFSCSIEALKSSLVKGNSKKLLIDTTHKEEGCRRKIWDRSKINDTNYFTSKIGTTQVIYSETEKPEDEN